MADTPIIWKGKPFLPPRIFCIGKYYAGHVKEMGGPKVENLVVFMKPCQSITDVLRSEDGETLHYESEITFLIEKGQPAGVAFGFDLTKRDTQRELKKKGLPWEQSKAFRGSALFSEFVPIDGPVENLEVVLKVDGKLIQHGRVHEMIHSPKSILEGLMAFQDLENGDLVMTGTPAGVGPLKPHSSYEGLVLLDGRVLSSKKWVCQ